MADEVQATESPAETIEVVDPFAALAQLDEVDEPLDEEPEASPAAPAEEVVAASPPVISHPPELLERAAALMIPADEVAGLSTVELQRVIKHADRIGQMVYESMAKPEKALDEKPAEPVDDLAVFDDPAKYDPEFINPIKAILADVKKELKAKDERIAQLEKRSQSATQNVLHQRLTADLAPEVAKVFDVTTTAGQKKYAELLKKMGADQQDNPNLPEKRLRERAIKAMEIVPEKPQEAPTDTAAVKRWDNAALAKPTARKTKESAADVVGRILREAKVEEARRAKQTNGSGH